MECSHHPIMYVHNLSSLAHIGSIYNNVTLYIFIVTLLSGLSLLLYKHSFKFIFIKCCVSQAMTGRYVNFVFTL